MATYANVTVRELVDKCSLDEELLDEECQFEDFLELGRFIDSWKLIGEHLGLTPEQTNAIDRDQHTTEEKRVAMLKKWKQKFAFKATYRKLTETLLSCERADLAQRVCEHLATKGGISDVDLPSAKKPRHDQSMPVSGSGSSSTQMSLGSGTNEDLLQEKWKTLYKAYKDEKETAEVDMMLSRFSDGDKSSKCLLQLASCIADEFPSFAEDQRVPAALKQQHPQYQCVKAIIEGHIVQRKSVNVMETLVLFVTCCKEVNEVIEIIRAILSIRSKKGNRFENIYSLADVVDIFFCMATLFYGLWNRDILPQRFHYYVYYAIDLTERDEPIPSEIEESPEYGGIQSLTPEESVSTASQALNPMSTKLTKEQEDVVFYDYKKLQKGDIVKIEAFPGTGKTFTLVQLAKKCSEDGLKILYCAFNKSIMEETARCFSTASIQNVDCATLHSLAWEEVGKSYEKKVIFNGDINTKYIKRILEKAKKREASRAAKEVCDTLKSYFVSIDEEIGHVHVDGQNVNRDMVVEAANYVWQRMQSLNEDDDKVKMPHNGYLKLYQLREPKIRPKREYDMILVDESQDLTAAEFSIIKHQKCIKVIAVSPHQWIYGFRGASNDVSKVEATETFYLTRSFRFGPEIAYVGSLVLDVLKGVKKQTLVGTSRKGNIQGDGQLCKRVAILSKFNGTLFEELDKLVKSGRLNGRKVYLKGVITCKVCDVLLDMHNLQFEKRQISELECLTQCLQELKVKSTIKTFNDIEKHVENEIESVLFYMIQVCNKYQSNLPDAVDRIKTVSCQDFAEADNIVTTYTVFRSKGLEFGTVIIADDLLKDPMYWSSRPFADFVKSMDTQSRNLVYIAVTRAKKQLILSPKLLELLDIAKEPFLYPVENPLRIGKSLCIKCHSRLCQSNRMNVPLKQPTFKFNTDCAEGGMVCKFCAEKSLPSLVF